jgi:DNA repair exonuclease SbcCD ATPase subunit
MIEFEKIRWKNFLSTGNNFTELALNGHATTLVIGENGSGKSTFLDALTYGLFSKPFRKINKNQIINSVNNKACLVEIEFKIGSKNYLVRRGIKPTVFEIYVDGELINQDSKAKDYQEKLEKQILKLTFKSFTQIILLGSSSFLPFMKLPAAHRREVIEDLLDIQIFSIMNQILKERYSENKINISDNNQILNLNLEKIDVQRKYIQEVKEINSDKIVDIRKLIETTNQEMSDIDLKVMALQAEVKSLSENIKDRDNLVSERSKLQQIKISIESMIGKIGSDINFFVNNTNCPVCKQDIEEDHRVEILHNRESVKDSKENGLRELNDHLEDLSGKLAAIELFQDVINDKEKDITSLGYKHSSSEDYVKKLNDEIEYLYKVKKKSYGDDEKLKNLKEEREQLYSSRKRLLKDRDYLSLASNLLKDTGIKTRIIKQYLPVMNKLINGYLNAMDSYFKFTLDENFNELIQSRFRDEFSYENFSEGEKMRIDLSLLFTWRSIAKMKNSANTNLLVLDEVFDSSLDSTGTEEFLKLIQTVGQDTNVFVISHKGDALYEKFENNITFAKVGNFSKVV